MKTTVKCLSKKTYLNGEVISSFIELCDKVGLVDKMSITLESSDIKETDGFVVGKNYNIEISPVE